MPVVSPPALTAFAAALFRAARVPPNEADLVANSLVGANLRGHDSHGVLRIAQYLEALSDGRLRPAAPFTVLKETPALVHADGGCGLGQVQAYRLLDCLLPRASHLGIAIGTLRNCGHIGRLGEFAEAATAQRLAFIATVNNHGFVGRGAAPPGGIEARIGTNPLCIGAPTHGEPVVLDMATTVVAEGKIRVQFNKGQPTPDGWLLDALGQPTTHAGALYTEPGGTILPLGGLQAYKGFGLGLLLDMLAGGLSGAPCSRPGSPNLCANAVVFLALDVDLFAGAEYFAAEATRLAESVRTSSRRDGVQEILLPGDPERRAAEHRSREGIPLDEGTWSQLNALATRFNVSLPDA